MGLSFIYGLVDPRDECLRYVGQTTDVRKRYSRHINPKTFTHKDCWIRGLLKLGLKPELIILDKTYTKEDTDKVECFWIASLKAAGANLVNLTFGGDGGPVRLGMKTPESVKAKISASHRGLKHSPETKALLTKIRTGLKASPESIEKRRLALKGRKQSPEAVANRTESLRRTWALKGGHHTEAAKEKMRQAKRK